MSRRIYLVLSFALTAFVLVVVGAAATYTLRPAAAPGARSADSVPTEVVRAREAEYRRLLDEANARLRGGPGPIAPAPSPEGSGVVAAGRADDDETEDDRPRRHHERRLAVREDDDG